MPEEPGKKKALSDFRGAVPSKGRGDFAEERRIAKGAMSGRVRKEVGGAEGSSENDPRFLARVETARYRAGADPSAGKERMESGR